VRSAVSSAQQADWMVIVDPPRRTPSGPRFHPISAFILRKVCGGAATPS
jgi:hypothetical protein